MRPWFAMILRVHIILMIALVFAVDDTLIAQNQRTSTDESLARLSKTLRLDLRSVINANYLKYSHDPDTLRFLSAAIIRAETTHFHVFMDSRPDYFIQIADTIRNQILFLGFVSRLQKYELWFSWLAPGRRASIRSLGKLLHLDVQALLIGSYLRTSSYRDSMYSEEFLHNAVITYQSTNFAGDSLHPSDYLVQMVELTRNASNSLTLAFVKRSDKFHLAFERFGAGKASADPVLIDIDSDGRKEIMILADESGNQSTFETIAIWRYRPPQFSVIFRQGLSESYMVFPYSYENKYSFRRNPLKPRLLDICYTISNSIEGIDPLLFEFHLIDSATAKTYRGILGREREVRDTVTFVFNGTRYVPQKRYYDYRRPFRRAFPEIHF